VNINESSNQDLSGEQGIPDSLLVICLAEAPAPAQSLIWTLADNAIKETGQRLEVHGLPLAAPEVLKVRSLSGSLHKLLNSVSQAVMITGLKTDEDAPLILHRAHRPAGQIIKPPGSFFRANEDAMSDVDDIQAHLGQSTPMPWRENEKIPLINTLHMNGELATMPAWLADDLPPAGFDFVGIPLPESDSNDWLAPQVGSRFPQLTEGIANILWSIIQGGDEGLRPGAIETSAG